MLGISACSRLQVLGNTKYSIEEPTSQSTGDSGIFRYSTVIVQYSTAWCAHVYSSKYRYCTEFDSGTGVG
eukprot:COSAG05_NODE_169_length_15161_cov_279.150644_10_plen_70_part_00